MGSGNRGKVEAGGEKFDQWNVLLKKLGILLLLGFLLLGTVAGDWFLGGTVTVGYGPWLLLGGLVALLMFVLGVWAAKRHRSFLGFSLWQWSALPVPVFAVGVALRVYVL